MDEIDLAVLDMSAFEFTIQCDDAYKHKGDGVKMHNGDPEATHIIYATCGNCGTNTDESKVCLSFVAKAFDDKDIMTWRCPLCRTRNPYLTTITVVHRII